MEGRLHKAANVEVAAGFSLSEAESTALSGSLRARSPANWAMTLGTVLALWIAESSALLGTLSASQRVAMAAVVVLLCAREADIGHASWAVWAAEAASNVVEVLLTLWIVEGAPLLSSIELIINASSSTVGVWLVAVGAIAVEVVWARLPAYWTVSNETWITLVVAQVLFALLVIST